MKPNGHRNPFRPINPDSDNSPFRRESVLRKLEGCFINVNEPSCAAIIAERGMGAPPAVKQFLREWASELRVRVIECDVKTDLGRGDVAADFYRALVDFIWRQLDDLPVAGNRAASRVVTSSSSRLDDLRVDLSAFFREIQRSGSPLLIVFYSFDRLPHRFHFDELDWTFLRGFHDDPDIRVYYLLVSRRPLRYVERLHNLDLSLFSTLFSSTTYRVRLLAGDRARELSTSPARKVLGQPPWEEWLAERIFDWGGRHPFCIYYICSELFEDIWNQGREVKSADASRIADDLCRGLRPYFDRLYDNLVGDQLIESLVAAVELGHTTAQSETIQELIDLGYFLPEPAERREYVLFSPLFYEYLVWRGVLHPAEADSEPEAEGLPRPSAAVQAILDMKEPPREIQVWLADYYQRNRRAKPRPDIDRFVMFYLTSYMHGLSEEDRQVLRRHLCNRYYYHCGEQGAGGNLDGIRSTFHSRCDRREKEFHKDYPP